MRLFPEAGTTETEASYDLVITDREADLALDASTRFCMGLVPADLRGLLSIGRDGTQVVDWRRNEPVFRHVELADLVIIEQPRSKEGIRAIDYETRGYDVLADGHLGPLLLQKRAGERVTYWLLFHTDRSTLPYRLGFPIIVCNLAQVAMDSSGLAEARGVRTGVLPRMPLEPGRTYTVQDPSERACTVEGDASGELAGVPAPRVGYYTIADGSGTVARVGACLLSASETGLRAVEQLMFDEDLSVTAATAAPPADRRLWPLLAWLAFGVLLSEWWLFHRKPGGPLP